MLILKYERLDFFHNRVYTEDKRQNQTKEDLKKAFSFFSKKYDAAIEIDGTVIYWDGVSDHENRIVTVRQFDGMNYSEIKRGYDKAKKECYAMAQ